MAAEEFPIPITRLDHFERTQRSKTFLRTPAVRRVMNCATAMNKIIQPIARVLFAMKRSAPTPNRRELRKNRWSGRPDAISSQRVPSWKRRLASSRALRKCGDRLIRKEDAWQRQDEGDESAVGKLAAIHRCVLTAPRDDFEKKRCRE